MAGKANNTSVKISKVRATKESLETSLASLNKKQAQARKGSQVLEDVEECRALLATEGICIFYDTQGLPYLEGALPGIAGRKLYTYDAKTSLHEVDSLLRQREKVVNDRVLAKALFDLAFAAEHCGPRQRVSVRTAERGDRMYFNLGHGRVVEITREGWEVIKNPPGVHFFWDTTSSLPLPDPERGGSIEELNELLRLSEEDWCLVLGWLVGAVKEEGHHLGLVLSGDYGAGKSTISKILTNIIDPCGYDNLKMSCKSEDVFTAARVRWVLPFEELPGLSPDKCGTLKSIATGGGYVARKKYSDGQTYGFQVNRPLLLNGTANFLSDEAFTSRNILLQWKTRTGRNNVSDTKLVSRAMEIRPRVLAGLFDLMQAGLATAHCGYEPDQQPRMAASAEWIGRCFNGSGRDPVRFLMLLRDAQQPPTTAKANKTSLSSPPPPPSDWFLVPVFQQIAPDGFTGLAGALLEKLSAAAGELKQRRDFPGDASALANQLKTPANLAALARAGILVEKVGEKPNSGRLYRVTVAAPSPLPPCGDNPASEPRPAPDRTAPTGRNPADVARQLNSDCPDLLVYCRYADSLYQVYGHHAEDAARVLNRPLEAGPVLTLTAEEWDSVLGQLSCSGAYHVT